MTYFVFFALLAFTTAGSSVIKYVAVRRVARRRGLAWVEAALARDWESERLLGMKASGLWAGWLIAGLLLFVATFVAWVAM
ncbi:MAG TPA: hypothetical protein VFP50_08155 [Anaeromyxobacteraceae bacterium]|nr:hypothetical protein [Anaeromyxobacteraceae bacterium]